MILLWIVIPLFIVYSILIIYFWLSWRSIKDFTPSTNRSRTRISVIIPARNEEKTIGSLLNALQQQNYPRELTEIIVVDDHSEDKTAEVVNQFSFVKLVRLQEDNINSYKKKAIETGIAASSGELIVTTDADCMPPEEWLQLLVSFKEERESVFIVAPVVIDCSSSLVEMFQAIDFMVLQGITGAVVDKNILSMCNGANMAYEKKAFDEVNGFTGVDHIASGDDMLLMHKIRKRYPDKAHYLKSANAIVSTQPMKTWKDFFNQRIRWASKAKQYNDKGILPILLLVYLLNLSFLVLLVAGFWNHDYWLTALLFWAIKTIIELPFFRLLADFFNKKWAVPWFFFFQPLHIFYTIIAGLFGQFGKYEWKGRRVK